MLSEEIQRLKENLQADEDRLKAKYEEECRLLEKRIQDEIDNEKNFIENCTVMEIGKLKEEVDAKIQELNENRYKDLETNENINLPDDQELLEKNRLKIEQEIAQEKEMFEKESKERRSRFNQQMKILFKNYDNKRIEYLKREIVPLVKAPGMVHITDETILETRHRFKMTRRAIRSGQSWALYNGQFQDKPVVCRVVVLSKIPVEIRLQLDNSTKCQRFLCRRPASDYFIRLYEIFATDQKVYVIMDEAVSQNMQNIVYKSKTNVDDLKKWYWQICDALSFMHNFAIAHLNLKLENVIFTENNDVKIVGLSRAFCYFNLDQEKYMKAMKVPPAIHYDHLPAECFETDFEPLKADVWSFALLMYEAETKHHPRRKKTEYSKIRSRGMKPTIELKELKNPSFVYDKIANIQLRMLIHSILDADSLARPNFHEISSDEYFRSDKINGK